MYIYESELMHHGIKGMHWGIRRFQSYEVTGKRKGGKGGRETGDAAKQKFSKVKKDRRKWKDLSEEEKESIKRRIIIGAAGVAAAAILGTAAYKAGKSYLGYTIKEGKGLERVTRNVNDDTHFDRVYAIQSNKHDRSKYSGLYAKSMLDNGADSVYRHHYKAGKMKIAGVKASKKVTQEMLKDPDVQQYVKDWRKIIKDTWEKDVKSPQQVLNIALTDNGHKGVVNVANTEKVQKMYTNGLKKLGYSGVIDMNDSTVFGKSVSNYYSKTAAIIFDTNKMKHVKDIKLDPKDIKRLDLKGTISSQLRASAKELALTPGALAIGATGAVSLGAVAKQEHDYQKSKKKGRKTK